MNISEKPDLNALDAKFGIHRDQKDPDVNGKQLRVDKKGQIYAKEESEGSGIRAFFSGQDKKFEAAEKLLRDAYERSAGAPPGPEIEEKIRKGVRGTDEGGVNPQSVSRLIGDLKVEAQAHAMRLEHAKIGKELVANAASPKALAEEIAKKLAEEGMPNQLGSALFEAVENSDLTLEEKQQVHNMVAEAVVKQESAHVSGGNTLLRGNTAGTNYMSAYMEQYAAEYNQAIVEDTLEAMDQIPVLKEAGDKNGVPYPGKDDNNGVAFQGDQKKQWDDAYVMMGNNLVESMQVNQNKLTPEARQFLETVHEAAQEATPNVADKEVAARTAVVSTLALRSAMPAITKEQVRRDKIQQNSAEGQFMKQSAVVNQSYFNFVDHPTPQVPAAGNKGQNNIVNAMRSPESLAQLKNFVSDVGGADKHPVKQGAKVNVQEGVDQNNAQQNAPQNEPEHVKTRETLHPNARKAEGVDAVQPEVGGEKNEAEQVVKKGNVQGKIAAFEAGGGKGEGAKSVKDDIKWKAAKPGGKTNSLGV